MSTYLQLVNKALIECGTAQTTPLTTLVGQTSAEINRIAGWVADAWTEIQTSKQTWRFLRHTINFLTIAGQNSYTRAYVSANLVTNSGASNGGLGTALDTGCTIKDWIPKTFRAWTNSIGVGDEQIMNHMAWDTFRNVYLYATQRTNQTRPIIVSIDPAKTLWMAPVPNAVYTIECEVYETPQTLALDADTPLIDAYWHNVIVYKTMMKYAGFEAAPEVADRAEREYGDLNGQLERSQMNLMSFGPPLA